MGPLGSPGGHKWFDRAALSALFPNLSADEAARMRVAAARVEAAKLPDDAFHWDCWPENLRTDPVGNGIQLSVLGTTLRLFTDLSDWLELGLFVVRDQRPHLTVSATIEVACWCEPDHNMHVVHSQEWLAGTATALTEAFESAADALVRWGAGSHDPLVHRAVAGLPNPGPR